MKEMEREIKEGKRRKKELKGRRYRKNERHRKLDDKIILQKLLDINRILYVC